MSCALSWIVTSQMMTKTSTNLWKFNFFGCDKPGEVFYQILFRMKSRNLKIFCSFVFKRSTGAAILGYGAAKS